MNGQIGLCVHFNQGQGKFLASLPQITGFFSPIISNPAKCAGITNSKVIFNLIKLYAYFLEQRQRESWVTCWTPQSQKRLADG